jgi:hypothetical protein
MRRIYSALLASALPLATGCSWSNFWANVADNINGASYRTGGDPMERDNEFESRYDQQAKAAQEYQQQHQ